MVFLAISLKMYLEEKEQKKAGYFKVLFSDSQKMLILIILYWFGGKLIKTRNPEAELQGLAYLDITANGLINYRIR